MSTDMLQRVRALLVEALALLSEPKVDHSAEAAFVDRVSKALQRYWPEHDLSPEALAELYRLSQGDADTLASLVARCAYRRSKGWEPESLSGYLLGVVRKVGIETLRAERAQRLERWRAAQGQQEQDRSELQLPRVKSTARSEALGHGPGASVLGAAQDEGTQVAVSDPVEELMALLREGVS